MTPGCCLHREAWCGRLAVAVPEPLRGCGAPLSLFGLVSTPNLSVDLGRRYERPEQLLWALGGVQDPVLVWASVVSRRQFGGGGMSPVWGRRWGWLLHPKAPKERGARAEVAGAVLCFGVLGPVSVSWVTSLRTVSKSSPVSRFEPEPRIR